MWQHTITTYRWHPVPAEASGGQSRKWATNVSFQLLKRSKCSSAKVICVGIALQSICRAFFSILPSCCMCVRCMRLNALQRALHTHTRCTCIFIRITHVVAVCTNRKKGIRRKSYKKAQSETREIPSSRWNYIDELCWLIAQKYVPHDDPHIHSHQHRLLHCYSLTNGKRRRKQQQHQRNERMRGE